MPTAASYPLPFALPDAAAAQRLALRLEDACAAAWRYLLVAAVRRTPTSTNAAELTVRRAGQDGLTASAVRAVPWRALVDPTAPTVPFPGVESG